jgi:hypothetical protein
MVDKFPSKKDLEE